MDQHDEIWLVQFNTGAVRAMTLDELDVAFQDGAIDEDTFVRRDGASKWSRLRDELGAEEPVAAAPAPQPIPSAPPAYQTYYSTRPVVSELDMGELDLEDSPFKKKSRKGTLVALGAALAVIAVAAFGATKLHGSAAAADVNVNASVVNAVQPQVVTPPPPVDPQATPQAKQLSDDQKKALANNDKQLNQKIETRRQSRIKNAPPPPHKSSPPPFHKGGNAYDPLNAKL